MRSLPGLSPDDFPAFFESLHGVRPFPWQSRLLGQLLARRSARAQVWPECMALPTASGKTACIDIALFHLALQAEFRPEDRTAPRRIFFCVDRRVIVDGAYERARRIAASLRTARDGLLERVARRLRHLVGDQQAPPLVVFELRGGTYRDDGWIASPLQSTVVCTTVDQLGSRLMFRGYGVSSRSAAIHAALTANDALILLDEAHCAEPFRQTLAAVRMFRGAPWADEEVPTPFAFVEMSATPRSPGPAFDLNDDDRRPKYLGRRLATPKPAELVETTARSGSDAFIAELARQAERFAEAGSCRIGVMVNRVDTAIGVRNRLAHAHPEETVLLIGRMRPLDRDALLARWKQVLYAGPGRPGLKRPVFAVATQCLEVGANLDFDALVTECASLDALRQRFGRLNRLGLEPACQAAIVAPLEATRESGADPIYGAALHESWAWLSQHAKGKGVRTIDFCPDAIAALLPKVPSKRSALLASLCPPALDAPVLLPANLDRWCQTAPRPEPDPDVSIFLHGPERGTPTVSVCWRADLGEDPDRWAEVVALCPPSAPECMPVPLYALRNWLAGQTTARDSGDTEHEAPPTERAGEEQQAGAERRSALLWRGDDTRVVAEEPHHVRPGDVVVIPAHRAGECTFGYLPDSVPVDRAEQAQLLARRRGVLRVCEAVRDQVDHEAAALFALQPSWPPEEPTPDDLDRLRGALRAWAGLASAGDSLADSQAARKRIAGELAQLTDRQLRRAIHRHPAGGLVLVHPRRIELPQAAGEAAESDFDEAADESSTAPARVTLAAHLKDVEACAHRWVGAVGLPAPMASAVARAARHHDCGKLDSRFQALLTGRPPILTGEPLAKSPAAAQRTPRAGLPVDFRHEMLSAQLADRLAAANGEIPADLRDLVLHLIASHHGHGRPFAPVVIDGSPSELPPFDGSPGVSAAERAAWTPAHRLDSGVCERFWLLTRRYGWWGLAYLESFVRVADRTVSRQELAEEKRR